jgi:hypothetical protein
MSGHARIMPYGTDTDGRTETRARPRHTAPAL